MRVVLGALSGAVMMGTLMLAVRPEPEPITAPASCLASETAADRCDRALLTALSVQVRMLGQLEKLEAVCAPKP